MAISLGRYQQEAARTKASEDIARQTASQSAKETKRKGWSNMLGKGLGALAGAGIAGALGIASGGLLMPLIMGASASMAKKWTDEATKKGMLGKGLKGGDPSQIKGGEYGYGRKEAASTRRGLEESRKTDWDLGTLGTDIAMSYVGAGVGGQLGGVKGALSKGSTGGLKQALGVGADYGTGTSGVAGVKAGIGQLFGQTWGEGGGDIVDPTTPNIPIGESQVDEWGNPISMEMQQGGQVPQLNQQQLLALIALAQQQQETAYDNTPLEESRQPTISEYFSSQNKTLGGSNTKSLSQMLGR